MNLRIARKKLPRPCSVGPRWDSCFRQSVNLFFRSMLAAHLGFCPGCFSTLERSGDGNAWYDCPSRKRIPYADLAIDFGLSSPESTRRVWEHAIKKLQSSCGNHFTSLFGLMDRRR